MDRPIGRPMDRPTGRLMDRPMGRPMLDEQADGPY